MKYMILLVLISAMFIPAVIADEDNYFSIRENFGPYEAVPDSEVEIVFVLSNRELLSPRNVTAYIDPCPVGWDCESKLFSYPEPGRYTENLTIIIPEEAIPKRYSLRIRLESYYWTQPGDNLVVIKVLSPEEASAIPYEEYTPRDNVPSNPAKAALKVAGEETPEVEETPVEEPAEDPVGDNPEEGAVAESSKVEEISENVERLETDRQFVEYLSIVLVIVLAFILVGAFLSFRKKEE